MPAIALTVLTDLPSPGTSLAEAADHLVPSKATWAHLHLPRLRAGVSDVISVKVPGQRIAYVPSLVLRDAVFKVHEAGRQRCLTENVRNVHAWVVGDPDGAVPAGFVEEFPGGLRKAVYDPWKGGTFVDSLTFEPVLSASVAVMVGKDVYYSPAACSSQAGMSGATVSAVEVLAA